MHPGGGGGGLQWEGTAGPVQRGSRWRGVCRGPPPAGHWAKICCPRRGRRPRQTHFCASLFARGRVISGRGPRRTHFCASLFARGATRRWTIHRQPPDFPEVNHTTSRCPPRDPLVRIAPLEVTREWHGPPRDRTHVRALDRH